MVFNPISMLTQEQQKFLQEVQKFTSYINVVIHKRDDSFEVTFSTENPQAKPYLSQFRDSTITSLAHTLYTFFNIVGKVK